MLANKLAKFGVMIKSWSREVEGESKFLGVLEEEVENVLREDAVSEDLDRIKVLERK